MENWQKAAIAAMAAVVLALSAFGAGFTMADRGGLDGLFGAADSSGPSVIEDAYDKIIENADEPPSERALTRGAIRGMVRVLQESDDPYANFYSPTGGSDLREVTEGRFSGIGVRLSATGRALEVVAVLPDSPALKEGIRKGDVIKAVDGKKVTPSTSATVVDRIKGRAGTKVKVTIQRGDRTIDFVLTRASLDYPSVTSRVTRAGVGYVAISSFVKGTSDEVRTAVEDLVDEGADGIMLDLRANPGGLLLEAVETAHVFMGDDRDVLIYRDHDGTEETYETECRDDDCTSFENEPLVVLVNGGSASASEILAGALQDNDRAELVGTRTFGKGKVQDVVELLDGSRVKLTTATYLTPSGRDIDGKGIEPDVTVEDPRAQERRAEALLEDIQTSSGAEG